MEHVKKSSAASASVKDMCKMCEESGVAQWITDRLCTVNHELDALQYLAATFMGPPVDNNPLLCVTRFLLSASPQEA